MKILPFNIIVILGTGQIGSCSRTSIWYFIIYCLARNKSIFPPLFILISRIFPKISKSKPSAWPRVLSWHHFTVHGPLTKDQGSADKGWDKLMPVPVTTIHIISQFQNHSKQMPDFFPALENIYKIVQLIQFFKLSFNCLFTLVLIIFLDFSKTLIIFFQGLAIVNLEI